MRDQDVEGMTGPRRGRDGSGGAASGKLLQAVVFRVTHGIVMFLGYIRDTAEPTMGESYRFISSSVYLFFFF